MNPEPFSPSPTVRLRLPNADTLESDNSEFLHLSSPSLGHRRMVDASLAPESLGGEVTSAARALDVARLLSSPLSSQ